MFTSTIFASILPEILILVLAILILVIEPFWKEEKRRNVGWLAAGGRGGLEPWLLAVAIGTWVGGFDVLYACQDLDFDRAHGLHSIPERFGVPAALAISRALHVVTVAALAAIAWVEPLGPIYLAGVAGVAALLAFEQSLVGAADLSRVKLAFDLNGWVGILYFATTAASIYVH